MNYPGNIKKGYKKTVNYANRGMDLENFINQANSYYVDNNIAVIYKNNNILISHVLYHYW